MPFNADAWAKNESRARAVKQPPSTYLNALDEFKQQLELLPGRNSPKINQDTFQAIGRYLEWTMTGEIEKANSLDALLTPDKRVLSTIKFGRTLCVPNKTVTKVPTDIPFARSRRKLDCAEDAGYNLSVKAYS
uniref:Uncharacterized protein n=1 Tax=Spongospora subterranea TaxID=70186 RepID=A0A0H5QT52_9EUKA|eukprot:CRZ04872.1 hypothetical protein [Spongospora subterranea]